MCDLFFYANHDRLDEIPNEFMQNYYIEYLLEKKHILGFIPVQYRTPELCCQFIEKYPHLIKLNIRYVSADTFPEICQKYGLDPEKTFVYGSICSCMQKKEPRNGKILIKKD